MPEVAVLEHTGGDLDVVVAGGNHEEGVGCPEHRTAADEDEEAGFGQVESSAPVKHCALLTIVAGY